MTTLPLAQVVHSQSTPLYCIDNDRPVHPKLLHPAEANAEHGWLPVNHHARELYAFSAAVEELSIKGRAFQRSRKEPWALEAFDAQKQFIVDLFAVAEAGKVLLRRFRNSVKDCELLKDFDKVSGELMEALNPKQAWVRYRHKLGAHKELPVPKPRPDEICFDGLSTAWSTRFSEAELHPVYASCVMALAWCKSAQLCSWVRFNAEPNLVELWVPCKEQPQKNRFMLLPKEAMKALTEGRHSLYGKYSWSARTQFELKSTHLYRQVEMDGSSKVVSQVVALMRLS